MKKMELSISMSTMRGNAMKMKVVKFNDKLYELTDGLGVVGEFMFYVNNDM